MMGLGGGGCWGCWQCPPSHGAGWGGRPAWPSAAICHPGAAGSGCLRGRSSEPSVRPDIRWRTGWSAGAASLAVPLQFPFCSRHVQFPFGSPFSSRSVPRSVPGRFPVQFRAAGLSLFTGFNRLSSCRHTACSQANGRPVVTHITTICTRTTDL